MSDPEPASGQPAKGPGWKPRAFELADPTAEPDQDWTPGPVERQLRRAMAAVRPWMAAPALLLALGAAAVVPVGVVIEFPADVVTVGEHVVVEAPNRSTPAPGHTGTYLVPRRDPAPSALDWLLTVVRSDRAVVEAEPTLVNGLDPVESALLMGAGVAPGRADPARMGLSAEVEDPGITRASLALSLELFDQAGSVDLSRGRRILALGALTADGRVSCAADPAETLQHLDAPVDVVMLGPGCPRDGLADIAPGATLLDAPSLPDALVELSG